LAAMQGINDWVSANHPRRRKIAYFFEAGHEHQPKADALIKFIGQHGMGEGLRYSAHSFILKRDAATVQAADILAWQTTKWLKTQTANQHANPRKDFLALVGDESRYRAIHYGSRYLLERAREMLGLPANSRQ
jgi:hypothetical protein